MVWDFKTLAARHTLQLANDREFVDSAHWELDQGNFTPSLGGLATSWDLDQEQLQKYFLSALKEFDIPLPTQEEAILTLVESYMVALGEGALASRSALREFYELYIFVTYTARSTEMSRNEHSHKLIHEMVGRYWHRDDWSPATTSMLDGTVSTIESIDAEAVQFARNWCRDRWQPVFQNAWLTPSVSALAGVIDQDKAFDRLPILADALEEAGCDNADILNHCRGAGPHVRGCWVVDMVLGKG